MNQTNNIQQESMLRVGTILRGIYRIDSYLSSGGFGNTYVATNIEFDERFAIKEFFMKGVTQREGDSITVSVSNSINQDSFLQQKEKFKKEARRLRQLNNPHIVKVHDLFEENGTAYYVMDYVDGENLSERLKRTGQPMTEAEVNKILPQILDALKAVHDAGMWHLDLKPANIMLDKKGQVRLIDFGASKQLDARKGGATTSTAISYTNGYAPREQMEQNYDKFGPWTDIYAVGATLYNLLTNKRPPLPTDIDDDMSDDKHLALPMLNVSDKMKQLVLSMMKPNRLQRPQKVNDIDLEVLSPVQESKPAPADQDEETKIANKEEGQQDTKISTQQPINTRLEYEPRALPESEWINNVWILILILVSLVIGLLILVNKCNSNNREVPDVTMAQAQTTPSELQHEIIQGIWDNMVVADVGQCMYSIYINKYEVTRREWSVIMYDKDVPSEEKNLAMDGVSWEECQEFIRRLNDLSGKETGRIEDSFRLPSSSEWLDVVIGGACNPDKFIYSGSDNLDEVAWHDDEIHEVGLKKPNSLGIYDMTGNVAEWCSDGPSDEVRYIQGGLPSFTNSFPNNADPIEGNKGESPTPDGKWHLGFRLSMYKGS